MIVDLDLLGRKELARLGLISSPQVDHDLNANSHDAIYSNNL